VNFIGIRIYHRGTEEDEGAQREIHYFFFLLPQKKRFFSLCPLILLCASVVNPNFFIKDYLL
jgi:hypothetical protein